jgi:hypothetical protein
MHYSVSRDGIVITECEFLLVLTGVDDFQVIGFEDLLFMCVILDAVNEFNWRSVAVFCKERDGVFPSLDGEEDLSNIMIDKLGLLNLVDNLLVAFFEEVFDDIGVVCD